MRVLLVEDEAPLRETLAARLQREGFAVDTAADGDEAVYMGKEVPFDVAIVDLGLPKLPGLEVVKRLRESGRRYPILILTARGSWEDKVEGLKCGADDYLVKPFGAAELLARVRAQLRRQAFVPAPADAVLRFGRTTVDLARRVVERDGAPLHLTPIEYRLLTHLAAQPDRVITHQQLLKAVWGPGHAQDTHYVRVHMANLRKKVEADPSMPRHLLTEAGIGYRFRA